MQPSVQQQAIYDWVVDGKGSAIVEAVAGAGKTTTLVEAVKLMKGSIAFTAYNRKIADEIKERIGNNSNVEAGTFHSFGMKAWRKVAGNVEVDGRKNWRIIDELGIPRLYREFVNQAVSLAKQWGIGVLTPIENLDKWQNLVDHFNLTEKLVTEDNPQVEAETIETAIQYSIRVLNDSIAMGTKTIDFEDMIYLPLLHKVKFWQRDWVLIDEAQDTNPTRRLMAHRMLRPNGRLIAVGDPHQAIYGFTGANDDSLDLIQDEFQCKTLPLTVSYRCPKNVIDVARRYVNHIEAHESAPDGLVENLTLDLFRDLDRFHLDSTSAVLCRNTAPLVDIAFSLIARDIACHVEGKEIGLSLLKLAERWPRLRNLQLLSDKLREYKTIECKKLEDKKQETRAEALADKIDCLLTIIARMPTGSTTLDLKAKIEKLFGDTPEGRPSPNLTLSTIHKAKGREWNRVYWLSPNVYQPSKYAKQHWQKAQEINLMYVAVTRAKSTLVIVN